jgi:hypothetical protein
LVDRYAGQEKARVTELREVGSDECPPLLPLAAFRGKAGRQLSHVF